MRSGEVVGDLQDYDVAELLLTLARSRRSGWFEVRHPKGLFRLAMQQGRGSQAVLGAARNEGALALLLSDPRGGFAFREVSVAAGEAAPLYQWLLSALRLLPPPQLDFEGAARWNPDVPPDEVTLSSFEARALTRLGEGAALADLAAQPSVLAGAARLARLGLLVPRKVRVARLTLGVWRAGGREALIDERIIQAWEQQCNFSGQLLLRTADERVVRVAVRAAPGLGVQMLLSPETIAVHRLRVGDSLLARPE